LRFAFLQTLDAVLRHGSFIAAAHDVGLTPSAVGLQIKQLEEYFGQPLFDRSGRQARPTPFARELANKMQGVLAMIEALREKRTLGISGKLALGTIRSVQTTTLPMALREVRQRHPELSIRLTQGDSRPLLQQLNAGDLDAAVLVRPQSGGSSRLYWHNVAREPFVLIAPPTAKSTSVAELLQTHEWIRFDTALTGGRIAAHYVHRVAPRATSTIELASIEAIVAMVSAGLGVSLIPVPRDPLRGAYPVREIRLGRHAPMRQIAFVCRAADQEKRRVTAVRDAFERVYARLDGDAETPPQGVTP
jgi:DNA-binding transcriptional LysR family regulator